MSNYKLKTNKKVEENVVGIYKKIEDTVVNSYKSIENGAVNTYKKIESKYLLNSLHTGLFFLYDTLLHKNILTCLTGYYLRCLLLVADVVAVGGVVSDNNLFTF